MTACWLLCARGCCLPRKSDLRFERFITGTSSPRTQTCMHRPADVRFGSASLLRKQGCALLRLPFSRRAAGVGSLFQPLRCSKCRQKSGGNSETACDGLIDACASPLYGCFHSPRQSMRIRLAASARRCPCCALHSPHSLATSLVFSLVGKEDGGFGELFQPIHGSRRQTHGGSSEAGPELWIKIKQAKSGEKKWLVHDVELKMCLCLV